MTHTLKRIDGSTVDVRVEFGTAELHGYIDEAEQLLASEAKIDGFRQGKAPRELVRQRVGEQRIREEALQRAVGRSLDAIAEKERFDIVDQADFAVDKNNEETFSYSIRLIIVPEFQLGQYKDLHVKRKQISVSQDDVDEVMRDIQNSHTEFRTADRPAEKGDRVEINFSLFNKGTIVEGGASHNHPIIVGKDTLVPGFEEHIVGLRAGDKKQFQLNVPNDYYQKTIAGQTLDVDLELVTVQSPHVPELDDDFAKKLGKFTSVSDLRENIMKGLTVEK